MTLKLKEQRWFKPTIIGAAVAAAALSWVTLAGGIYLKAAGLDYTAARPNTVYRYWQHYGNNPRVRKMLKVSTGAAGLLTGTASGLLLMPKKPSLYGDARLARRADFREAELFIDDGILIGKSGGDYLKVGKNQHVLLRAPTGEGKGVAVVMPNALAWRHSLVAFDLKGELYKKSSGWRAKFHPTFVFNPLSEDYTTHCYNPLAYIPEDHNLRINEIQKIANMFFPDIPGKEPIWTATPRSLFMGITLMLLEIPGKLVTMGQVLRETLVEDDGCKYFARVIKERQEAGQPLSRECVMSLNTYTSIAAPETRAGIISGFRAALELWANPLIDAATSKNDFDFRLIRKTPMTVYVVVSQDNLLRMGPLLRLFYQQLIDLNTRQELHETPELQHPCLMILDEEAALGNIPALTKGIAYLRSYGMPILSVFQSMGQVVELLNRDGAQNYATNHGVQIIYPPKATETAEAEEISKWMGETTVKVKSWNSKGGHTTSLQKRRLMLPQEIVNLDAKWAIMVKRGMPPAIVKKIVYYKDKHFKERLLPPIDIPKIDMKAHSEMVAAAAPAPRPSVVLAKPEEVIRPIVAEDLPNLGNLALSDFALTFTKVTAPVSDTLDIEALNAYADMRCREAGINVEVTTNA